MTMNDESHCDSSNQTAFSGGANKVKHRWLFSFSFRLFRARRFKKKNKNKQKTNKKQKKPQQQHSTVEWGLAEFGWQRKTKWPTTKRKKRLFFPEKTRYNNWVHFHQRHHSPRSTKQTTGAINVI